MSSSARLIVVDDDSFTRELYSTILESEGYEVLMAKDGLEALALLTEPLPDLIITDVHMPRMSGPELIATVRREFPQIRVLVISSDPDGQLPPDAAVDGLLRKAAFTPDQFRAKIRELLPGTGDRQRPSEPRSPAA